MSIDGLILFDVIAKTASRAFSDNPLDRGSTAEAQSAPRN